MKYFDDAIPHHSQASDRNTLIAHTDRVELHNHYGAEMSAKDFHHEILIYLESRRAQFSPGAIEQREHCIASALNLRATLSNGVFGKQLSDREFYPIREMVDACNAYLDQVGSSDGRIFLITAQNACDWFDNASSGSLGKLRGTFRSVIKRWSTNMALTTAKRFVAMSHP